MLEKITKFRQWWEKLGPEDLKSLRVGVILLVVADLLGVWWFIGWKKIAILIFIFSMALLVVVLIYERRVEQMEEQKKIEDKKKEKGIEEQIADGVDQAMDEIGASLDINI